MLSPIDKHLQFRSEPFYVFVLALKDDFITSCSDGQFREIAAQGFKILIGRTIDFYRVYGFKSYGVSAHYMLIILLFL